jgi:hypothetical protein
MYRLEGKEGHAESTGRTRSKQTETDGGRGTIAQSDQTGSKEVAGRGAGLGQGSAAHKAEAGRLVLPPGCILVNRL